MLPMNDKRSSSGLVVNSVILRIFNYFLLVVAVIIIIAPMLGLVTISLKSNEEYAATGVFEFPQNVYLENFKTAIIDGKMHIGLKNVVILIVPSVIGSVLFGSMAAYVLSRFDFKINDIILKMFLLAMVIPTTTTLIATFNIIKLLGVFNTIYAGILIYLHTGVIDLYIFMQFIKKIPKEQDECAMLDGSSYFRIYHSIILPQMKPAIATVAILKIVAIYNDYFVPLTFMNKPELHTLSVCLYRFVSDHYQRWNILAAGILLLLIPSIIIYLFTQKYIIAGVTEGSIK